MPIEFFTVSGRTHIRQSFDSPTVYLDHWAIRLLSDNLNLQTRFVNALKSKGGTLLLSNFSFLEFSKATDTKHSSDAEDFLDRLLPNIYFTDFAIDKTHKREIAEPNNKKRFWPPTDLPTLKYFIESLNSDSKVFTMHGLISLSQEHKDELLQVKKEIVCNVRNAILSNRDDSQYVAKARNIHPSDERTRTYTIFGELIRGFTLDSNSNITDNDIIDLFHSVSPLNCCDYILLDGPWSERVKKMNLRISKTGMNMPIAKCFSKRDNGIELFLSDLESFERANHLAQLAQP